MEITCSEATFSCKSNDLFDLYQLCIIYNQSTLYKTADGNSCNHAIWDNQGVEVTGEVKEYPTWYSAPLEYGSFNCLSPHSKTLALGL